MQIDVSTEIEQLRLEIEPYLRNQFIGQASGERPVAEGAAEGTALRTALLKGKTTVITGDGANTDTLLPSAPDAFVMERAAVEEGEAEKTGFSLPEGMKLYSTPNDEYRDSYDVLTGTLTGACSVYMLKNGWLFRYSPEAETVTWITGKNFIPNRNYYLMLRGKVSTRKTDWEGKIELIIQKSDIGIEEGDSTAAITQKVNAYIGDGYAILPSKTPQITQYESVKIPMPKEKVILYAHGCETEIAYCRDMNAVYNELKQ